MMMHVNAAKEMSDMDYGVGNNPGESADRAAAALDAYKFRGLSPNDLMSDFLPDLMHWCAREGVDWGKHLAWATQNFKSEVQP